MHEYMETALADALGISLDEFETRRGRQTAYEIAWPKVPADEIPRCSRRARPGKPQLPTALSRSSNSIG
jgi:hypothetical protein